MDVTVRPIRSDKKTN